MSTFPNDMDEFVNWDKAGDAAMGDMQFSAQQDIDPALAGLDTNDPSWDNIDLMLANVNEDDFSFCALQHFAEQNPLPLNDTAPLAWETPQVPCANCALGGFSCKKIREGSHKGYCTSCVALTVDCSFGGVVPDSLNPGSTTFTADPWSNMGEQNLSAIPKEDLGTMSFDVPTGSSTPDLFNAAGSQQGEQPQVDFKPDAPPPKVGARFSRESVRILKTWLTSHNRHPYPSDEEKEMLQRKTGLNKTQITNWLANARRRGKVQAPRSTSPHVSSYSSGVGSIDIPQRRGTPALEAMNPLQRWQHSPPEHEPASVTAIARAVTASSSGISSGLNSPFSLNYTDDGSSHSICNQSSASSLGTSQSSSLGSAYSHGSRNSFGSFGSAPFSNKGRRRRRRRTTPKQGKDTTAEIFLPLKTFQCTFCTETFRTKHDWQRHEKSLHLSLERWVCAPHGPRVMSSETGQLSCVFCGVPNPDDDHIESHNHSTCQERSLDERTFYRKDHLNQHLRLVHDVKFSDASMKTWKIATPEIRSRCGFCGIVMDTWSIRIDHLAEHFKTGKSMADWKGDWGFEVPVLDMVENSIPPYLIHYERTSPLPYVASHSSPESPRNAYELIKLELSYFSANHQDMHGRLPTDEEMLLEGCRIIFASELLSLQGIATQASWLRDLIMKSNPLVDKARFGRVRGATENRLASLKINGKDNLFEQCPMEMQLHEFVRTKRLLGLTAMDDELQAEACKIVGRVEEVSTHPSDAVANWLVRMIQSTSHWLGPFRRRAHLPRSEDVQKYMVRSTDPMSIDSTIHNYTRLERELADFLKVQRSLGVEPSDEDLQRQARIIIYEFDDGWNQTAADNQSWLAAFKDRHPVDGVSPPANSSPNHSLTLTQPSITTGTTASSFRQAAWDSPAAPAPRFDPTQSILDKDGNHKSAGFFNDANCYRRLERELGRWARATMSPHNPNSHVPTDAELQHQARWIIYDNDDPWNQTAADNIEWLERFKRDQGLVEKTGPGLPQGDSWNLAQGGTGFEPPFVFPNPQTMPNNNNITEMQMDPNPHSSSLDRCAMDSFMSNLSPPATVFCSRELEQGLIELTEHIVAVTGRLPTDQELQARARQIAKCNETPADDAVLLGKFQRWMREKMPSALPSTTPVDGPSALPANLDLNISDEELGNILQDMNVEFLGRHGSQSSGQLDLEDGGVRLTGFKD